LSPTFPSGKWGMSPTQPLVITAILHGGQRSSEAGYSAFWSETASDAAAGDDHRNHHTRVALVSLWASQAAPHWQLLVVGAFLIPFHGAGERGGIIRRTSRIWSLTRARIPSLIRLPCGRAFGRLRSLIGGEAISRNHTRYANSMLSDRFWYSRWPAVVVALGREQKLHSFIRS